MAVATRSKFYPELESVRGIAALTVVLFHVFGSKSPGPQTLTQPTFDGIVNLILTSVFGGTGAVTVFFVLSGFVLSESLKRYDHLDVNVYLSFAIKRIFRLMPAAWASIALAIGLMVFYHHAPVPRGQIIPALYLAADAVGPFNGPLWSLHVELWSSALFPLLVFANRFISPLFQLAILAFLYWMSATSGFPYFTIFLFCFQFGIMVRSLVVPFVEGLNPGLATALLVVALAAVLVPTNLSYLGLLTTKDHTHIEGLGAVYIIGYILSAKGERLALALQSSPLRFLGRISYSLYVFHFPLVSLVETWIWAHIVSGPYIVAQTVCAIAVVPVCILAGVLGYHLIEVPFQRLGRKIANAVDLGSGRLPVLKPAE